jgi:lipopolysaccharide biosynthesis glycosyltransferase
VKVFIGEDPKEKAAGVVARASLKRRAKTPVSCTSLHLDRLASSGLLRRPVDARGALYDLHSQAPQSTEFAISRFLVPMLAQQGWALFVDADVVFLEDVGKLLAIADPKFAVYVVKHQHSPTAETKMVDQVQTRYSRKNWSSVCLWNCDHPANRRLTLDDVNHRPGRDLHAFYWLHDSEIGTLPPRWNWLVGEQPMPDNPAIAHFTNGGPWLPGWAGAEHDDIWLDEALL